MTLTDVDISFIRVPNRTLPVPCSYRIDGWERMKGQEGQRRRAAPPWLCSVGFMQMEEEEARNEGREGCGRGGVPVQVQSRQAHNCHITQVPYPLSYHTTP